MRSGGAPAGFSVDFSTFIIDFCIFFSVDFRYNQFKGIRWTNTKIKEEAGL